MDPISQYRVSKFRRVITKNPLTNEVLSSERFEALDSLNNPGLTETDLFKIEYPPRLEEIVGISDLKDTLKDYMKDYAETMSFGENIFKKQIVWLSIIEKHWCLIGSLYIGKPLVVGWFPTKYACLGSRVDVIQVMFGVCLGPVPTETRGNCQRPA